MGVLDKIDFSYERSADSSIDFRLLDAPCDHLIRNEEPDFDIADIISNVHYSGGNYNTFNYGAEIDPAAEVIVTTNLPYINDGSFIAYEKVINSTQEIEENKTVPSNYDDYFQLIFPPMTNTTRAKQKVYVNETDYKLIDFTRYSLAQLNGNIKFTNENDVGEEIVFYYLPDKKMITQKNSDYSVNYEFLGLDANGRGRFKFYGRAFKSTNSKLLFKYKTSSSSCQKCGGKNEINDIVFDENGRVQLVYDFSKLIQDFFKRLLTQKGTNPFDPSDGTEMSAALGLGKRNPDLIDTLVKNEIIALLNSIRSKQGAQADVQGISLAEQIYEISNVYVRTINTTDLEVEVEVLSRSGLTQQIKTVVRR